MITRLYVNNYRCLVAFETTLNPFSLICGPNGAGKSSVFDACRVLRDLASADVTTDQAISYSEHTNWLDSNIVEFEIDLTSEGRSFTYRLHIEQVANTEMPRIIHEQATCETKLLFERDLKGVRFANTTGAQTGFPLDWRQAALGSIQPAGDRKEIELLQRTLRGIMIIRPNPLSMELESREERSRPDLYLSNLTSWYRHLAQEQEWSDHLRNSLQGVWPDFRSFRLVGTGLQAKALQLRFDNSGDSENGSLYFHQLSDGEKMLIGLYMIQSALATHAIQSALIDEPDNYVGLPELQPWMLSVMELLGKHSQALLISHHPELLDLSAGSGKYIWRDTHTSPTRMGQIRPAEGLSVSETVARGWVGADA
jgi:predicted ATPase